MLEWFVTYWIEIVGVAMLLSALHLGFTLWCTKPTKDEKEPQYLEPLKKAERRSGLYDFGAVAPPKKCFCGRSPEMRSEDTDYACYRKYAVFCECGAVGGESENPTEAVAIWNFLIEHHVQESK